MAAFPKIFRRSPRSPYVPLQAGNTLLSTLVGLAVVAVLGMIGQVTVGKLINKDLEYDQRAVDRELYIHYKWRIDCFRLTMAGLCEPGEFVEMPDSKDRVVIKDDLSTRFSRYLVRAQCIETSGRRYAQVQVLPLNDAQISKTTGRIERGSEKLWKALDPSITCAY